MPADKNERLRKNLFRNFRQVDDFGNVCEIVSGETDRFGPKSLQLCPKVAMRKDLQIEHPDLMPGAPDGRCHALHSERLETQINLAVHQGAGMNQKNFHQLLPEKFCRLELASAHDRSDARSHPSRLYY